MLANPTKWLRESTLTKPITYSGTIIDNNDPLKIGRVTVRVKEMYGGYGEDHILDEDLPWINQQPASFLGNSIETSSFAVPEIGTEVSVEFPTSDSYFGYYKGGSNTILNRNDAFDEDYPNSYGFTDSTGNIFKVNKTKGTWEFKHPSGNYVKMNQDETIDIYQASGNTLKMNPDGTVDLITTTLNITATTTNISGDLNVTGIITTPDCLSSGKSGATHTHTVPEHAGISSAPL